MSGVAAPGSEASDLRPKANSRSLFAELLLPPEFIQEREVRTLDWVEGVAEPVLLIAMIVCLAVVIVQFVLIAVTGWEASFLMPVLGIAATAGFFYSRRLIRGVFRPKEWLVFLVPLAVALRLLPFLLTPADFLPTALDWWRHPDWLLSASWIFNCVLLVLIWWQTVAATQDLNQIRPQRGELPDERRADRFQIYDDGWKQVDHTSPLRRLALRFLTGGVVAVVLGGLAATGVQQWLSIEGAIQLFTVVPPAVSQAMSNVILYFVLGFLLLAEAQFVRQETAWLLEKLTPPPSLAPRWLGMSVAAVGVVLVAAMVLPTDYSVTLADIFGWLFEMGVRILLAMMGLAVWVMVMLVTPLTWLFPKASGDQPTPTPEPAPPQFPTATHQSFALPEVLVSVVFWLVVFAVLAFCVRSVWPYRRSITGRGVVSAIWRLAARVLRAAGDMLRRVGTAATAVVRAVLPQSRPARPRRILRRLGDLVLSRLGPRQMIEYFYLSVVERAARLGLGRAPHETALEYSDSLRKRMPEVEPDLDALTDAFLEARYGPRPVGEAEVGAARQRWNALKRRLRGVRLGRQAAGGAR